MNFSTTEIGFLWAMGVFAEIFMFSIASKIFQRFSWRSLVIVCLLVTSIRWMLVAVFSHYFIGQLFAQCLHAFSFGLFHLIAMRVIFQNFSAGQQGRGQALYSTMWGLGVAFGSVLAGHFWKILSGELIFMCASVVVLLGLCFVKWLPKQVDSSTT
ncbi:MFS transporter [Acinetobacter pittii]|nr:MFS transporter [Acinetobacter pittii]